jgi:hypothetical protein
MSYSEDNGITVESIQEEFDCDESVAEKILAICEVGYSNGLEKLYLDEEPKYDDEWDCSIGQKIRSLEEELELDNEEIYAYYMEALNAGHNSDNAYVEALIDFDNEDEYEGFSFID